MGEPTRLRRDDLSLAEIIRRIGLVLTSELDQDRLVQRLTDEATALVGAQFGAFFYNVTRESGESYMLYTLSGAPREAFDKFGMPRNTAVFAPTFAGEGVTRSDDITKDARYGKNAPHRGMPEGHLPVRSYLAVPVRSPTGVVHGGLFFGHPDVGVFDERAERLVVGIAGQAAVALDNALLFAAIREAKEAVERRSHHLALVADVAVAFAKEADVRAALKATTDAIVAHLGAAFARIWTIDRLGKTLELQVSSGLYTHVDGPHARVPVGAFKIGKIAEERRPHLTNDVLHDARVGNQEWARAEGMVAFAGYPLLAEGHLLGVVALFSRTPLGEDTLAALASVADVVSVGVDRKRADEGKRAAEGRQEALVEAGRALSASLDYETTLATLAAFVVPRFADWCAIDVTDADGQPTRRAVVVHRDPARRHLCEAFKAYPVRGGEQPAAVAMRTRGPLILDDVTDETLAAATVDEEHRRLIRALGARSAVAIPLLTNERLVGAITVVSEHPRQYTHDDATFLEEVGRRAALALDNARLYREAEIARQRLASIFEQAPAAIATTRGEAHVFETVNARYVQLVGRRELVGRSVREAFPELVGQGLFELLDEVFRTAKPYVGDEVHVRFDRTGAGTVEDAYFNFVYQPLVEADGRVSGIMVFAVEVTELVLSRHRVEHLARALERSNEELDQFAYVASHDLKAPLRGIANLSEWVEEAISEQADAETKTHLNLMRGRVHRLEALIDGILNYSRAGRRRDPTENIDSGAIAREAVELLSASMPASAKVEIAADMPVVDAERTPFQQIFMNLIANALKHARRDDVHVRIGCTDGGNDWRFFVADNGPGISPEYHERVWGIFQTLEARDRVEGTGVGLSIVKKVAETRGGRVWIESVEGGGATFWVAWPKAPRTIQ